MEGEVGVEHNGLELLFAASPRRRMRGLSLLSKCVSGPEAHVDQLRAALIHGSECHSEVCNQKTQLELRVQAAEQRVQELEVEVERLRGELQGRSAVCTRCAAVEEQWRVQQERVVALERHIVWLEQHMQAYPDLTQLCTDEEKGRCAIVMQWMNHSAAVEKAHYHLTAATAEYCVEMERTKDRMEAMATGVSLPAQHALIKAKIARRNAAKGDLPVSRGLHRAHCIHQSPPPASSLDPHYWSTLEKAKADRIHRMLQLLDGSGIGVTAVPPPPSLPPAAEPLVKRLEPTAPANEELKMLLMQNVANANAARTRAL